MNDKIYLIKKAYELLDRVTPLTYDCGKLCGGRCCKGDGNTGMWLFPYEEEILKDIDSFETRSEGADVSIVINLIKETAGYDAFNE